MNKQHDSIESLLETGRETGLSTSEQGAMWQTLREYAEFHPAKQAAPSPYFLAISKWLAVTATALVFCVSTGAVATTSLPGEALYPVKVKVVEPFVGLTKLSETDQLTYQAELFDRRLSEMQELLQSDQLNEDNVTELAMQVGEHGDEIQDLLANDTDDSIAPETKLDVLTDVSTTLKTHEFIEDTEISKKKNSFDDTQKSIAALYTSEAHDFATKQPAGAAEYIQEELAEIDSSVDDIGTTTASTSEIGDYLSDVEQALDTGAIDKALQYTGEVHQIVDLNKNIEDLEDDSTESEHDSI